MINKKALLKRNKLFQRLTGLTLKEYYLLRDRFYSAWQRYIVDKNNDPNRIRKYGGGSKPKSLKDLDDKLIFILCYVRIYPLQFIQGMIFGISEVRACLVLNYLYY